MNSVNELPDLHGSRVFVRSDLNVPMADGEITDDGRILASVPTIQTLVSKGARVIVAAHLGRPAGTGYEAAYTLAPVAARLGEALGQPVQFASDTVGPDAQAKAQALSDGQVLLLENLRFNAGETSKDDAERGAFADQLAALADRFVSDGFGVVHRKQASVYDIATRLPATMGTLVAAEVDVLGRLTRTPSRPYAVVLGGAKVADKLAVIDNLLKSADRILIGGGMVFTFLAAEGFEVGSSLLDGDSLEACRRYLDTAAERGVEIVLPVDIVAGTTFAVDSDPQVYPASQLPADRMGLDIGPKSAERFAEKISDCQTVFWNGPMGAFEMAPYAAGTRAVAQGLVDATSAGALTVVGGGDSAAAVRDLGFSDDQFSHISTGGGASLEYLEGKPLPGLTVLEGA